MSLIASVILPLFGLILAGYLVGRRRAIPAGGIVALEFFVFYLALPALFFRLIAGSPISGFSTPSFVATTVFATYCAFALTFSFGALINRGRIPEATMLGLAGSYGNLGMMAPALTIALLGQAAAVPTALIISFDHALMSGVVPLMMALGGTQRTDKWAMSIGIARRIFLNPIVLATIAGFAWSATRLRIPQPIDSVLAMLAGGAAPSALFALGLALAHRPVRRVALDVPAVIVAKLILHPLIVYLLLSWIGGFERVWVYAAMLLAALPPAMNVLAIARRYDTFADRASSAILYGTAASFVTVTILVTLVATDALPVDPFH
jgi:predicted permease